MEPHPWTLSHSKLRNAERRKIGISQREASYLIINSKWSALKSQPESSTKQQTQQVLFMYLYIHATIIEDKRPWNWEWRLDKRGVWGRKGEGENGVILFFDDWWWWRRRRRRISNNLVLPVFEETYICTRKSYLAISFIDSRPNSTWFPTVPPH